MNTCRRCGLPRRRTLVTPDGKTFSFPGFAVRRHRGLLLASGAALCCCCVDQTGIPTSDFAAGGFTGATYTNIDEWPADDATTQMTQQIVGELPLGSNDTAQFGMTLTSNGEDATWNLRGKIKRISASGSGASIRMFPFSAPDVRIVWSAEVDDTWQTASAVRPNPGDNPGFSVIIDGIAPFIEWYFAISAVRVNQLCP